jgi:hypothetical protein
MAAPNAQQLAEWELLLRIALLADARLQRLFLAAVQIARTLELQRRIEFALGKQNTDLALRLPAQAWLKATQELQVQTSNETLDVFGKAFAIAGDELGLKMSFDLTNPAAVEFARYRSSAFARTLNADTQRALRTVVSSSFLEGIPVRETARRLTQAIGLAPRDVTAVANYRRQLERLTERDSLDGLSKTDMDLVRRSDVRLLSKQGLDAARIGKMTDVYGQRLLKERALTLVRTETMAASNAGQQTLWTDAQANGLFGAKVAERKFIVTPDDRLCPICRGMKNQVRGMNEDFVSTYDGTTVRMPPVHRKCRCVMGLVFRPRLRLVSAG